VPTYVYRFIDTGETIEVRQSFDDAALTEAPHPSDGKPRPVKKVFTPVGVTFKGSGFYKTDSSSGSSKSSSAGAAGGDGSTSTADSGAKSDGAKTGGSTADGGSAGATKTDGGTASPSGSSSGSGTSTTPV